MTQLLDCRTQNSSTTQTRDALSDRAAVLTKKPVTQLTPLLQFEGEPYVLLTPQLAGIARSELGSATGSLAERRDTILAALDFLLTGF